MSHSGISSADEFIIVYKTSYTELGQNCYFVAILSVTWETLLSATVKRIVTICHRWQRQEVLFEAV